MINFNSEVHRATIRKVDREPESKLTMVQSKKKKSSLSIIQCNKKHLIVTVILRTDAGGYIQRYVPILTFGIKKN